MINVNNHSSIQINDIFIDPYGITETNKKARYIFITHTHYDHLSLEDIKKIISKETIFVAPKDAQKTLEENFPNHEKFYVEPNQELKFDNFEVKVIPAYNINKNFHKKEFGWVGYVFKIDSLTYTILGDTDEIPEHETLKTNVLFVPIGGTYTMNAEEAALLVNKIKPDLAVPVHYNAIVGSKEDEEIFLENLDKNIKYQIFL